MPRRYKGPVGRRKRASLEKWRQRGLRRYDGGKLKGKLKAGLIRPAGRKGPAFLVTGNFNARTSALKRHYVYRIVNRRADLTLELNRAWRVPRPLDAAAMHAAAQRLVGKHDFTTFRSTECQAKSPVKTLDRLDVERQGEEVLVTAVARSFLHNQVRSMVGSLVLVGDGKWSGDDLTRALAARDRTTCGQ